MLDPICGVTQGHGIKVRQSSSLSRRAINPIKNTGASFALIKSLVIALLWRESVYSCAFFCCCTLFCFCLFCFFWVFFCFCFFVLFQIIHILQDRDSYRQQFDEAKHLYIKWKENGNLSSVNYSCTGVFATSRWRPLLSPLAPLVLHNRYSILSFTGVWIFLETPTMLNRPKKKASGIIIWQFENDWVCRRGIAQQNE